jgi:hypothetical protein
VLDATGAILTGASVRLAGPGLGEHRVLTDEHGRYWFPKLPTGEYLVEATATGLTPASRTLRLPTATTPVVDLVLTAARYSERVQVTGEATIDVRSAAIAAVYDDSVLQQLPFRRTIAQVANLVPGITAGVAFGGTINSNAIAIDGVDVSLRGLVDVSTCPEGLYVSDVTCPAASDWAAAGAVTRAASRTSADVNERMAMGRQGTGRSILSPSQVRWERKPVADGGDPRPECGCGEERR